MPLSQLGLALKTFKQHKSHNLRLLSLTHAHRLVHVFVVPIEDLPFCFPPTSEPHVEHPRGCKIHESFRVVEFVQEYAFRLYSSFLQRSKDLRRCKQAALGRVPMRVWKRVYCRTSLITFGRNNNAIPPYHTKTVGDERAESCTKGIDLSGPISGIFRNKDTLQPS